MLAGYAVHYDHVVGSERTLFDRALGECAEKTVKAETVCVRQAVNDAHLSIKDLIVLIPACQSGLVCHYDHTTRDELGFVKAMATEFIVRWRVSVDLRSPVADAAHVPITVADRDDFDTTTAEAPPKK